MSVESWASAGLESSVEANVAHLTLNRPERRNAVTKELRHAMIEAVAETREDPEIRAVLMTGNGSSFCSGADISSRDWNEIPQERYRGSAGNVVREDGRRYGWWRIIKDVFGEPVDGRRAEQWGLANRCVPDEELAAVSLDSARRLAAMPTIAVGHIKGQVNDAYESSFEQVWKNEVTIMGLGIGSDGEEAAAAFAERREPRFTGR